MAQHEAFGMLCIAIAKRRKQSMLWTYLYCEPNEVTQFFQQVRNSPTTPSVQRLLKLPRISDIKKALAPSLESGNPEKVSEAEQFIKDVEHDYSVHGDNFVQIALQYLGENSANVRIYNKIKHGFTVVEGQDWFTPSLDKDAVCVLTNDKGEVGRLKMGQDEVDREMSQTHILMVTCAELMALCMKLDELGILYK